MATEHVPCTLHTLNLLTYGCRGAIQAGFFTYLLFLFSTNISKYFGGQDLPDQYTARNITVTIRTAVGGLAYLATFIFGANALGLAGKSDQTAWHPVNCQQSEGKFTDSL